MQTNDRSSLQMRNDLITNSNFISSGEDLVSEQENEAETRDAGLPRPPNPPDGFQASPPGSAPCNRRAGAPLCRQRPRFLRTATAAGPAADGSSTCASSHDPPPAFLLSNCHADFSDSYTYSPNMCNPYLCYLMCSLNFFVFYLT